MVMKASKYFKTRSHLSLILAEKSLLLRFFFFQLLLAKEFAEIREQSVIAMCRAMYFTFSRNNNAPLVALWAPSHWFQLLRF